MRRTEGLFGPAVVLAVLIGFVAWGWIWQPETPLGRFYTAPILIEFILGLGLFLGFSQVTRRATFPAFVGLMTLAVVLFYALAGKAAFLPSACLRLPSSPPFYLPYQSGRFTGLVVLLGGASYSLHLSHPYIIQLPVKVMGDSFGLPVTAAAAALAPRYPCWSQWCFYS